ncbi:EF-hand domain-containing protein [Sphingomonas elodea]|uniref:EF-hand domain-containing protein n=1 Tax=Sphingomonas elodea TaxID=179878 RepID=UPI000263045F|nr:EF-hand domain-containing protein [Sphingomonas elodea]
MLMPLLFAVLLQTAPAPQERPAPPATSAAPPAAAEATQPTPRPDPAGLPVQTQFAQADANGDGSLDRTEFAAWLVAVRTAKEAGFGAEKPEARDWIERSFGATDADHDRKITREEWTRFLATRDG